MHFPNTSFFFFKPQNNALLTTKLFCSGYDYSLFLPLYFWQRWVFVAARGLFFFSLVGGEWGLLFVAVRRLLTEVASLVVEQGF